MKKNVICCAIASTLILLGSHNASASNRPGAVTLTPGIGYDFFANKRNLNNTAVLPTIALAYNFTEQWALEGMYGSLTTNYKPANMQGGTNGRLYTIAGLYRFTPHGMFEPYVSAGLGVLYLNPNGSDANSQADLNAGIGTQIFFDKSVALRGEVRDLYTMSGGKNDVLVDLGVSFLMGGS